MNVGTLHYPVSPATLLSEIEKAAQRYHSEKGHAPNLCLVRQALLPKDVPDVVQTTLGKVTLRTHEGIIPDHLWIGEE
ncbi:MAG: hypothetical protein UU25_C0015G0018 [Microgenomates group bacterium GW2011_GWB1_40_9]|nr:MAG: hypothetical protein UT26_C0022G0021 [Microgenomates group bacterium GW2011_GWC1_39_12]KKR79390.1 MAG: hypothetical protein UU25_C0015G0018 [Microgenomates group bacterium GW2011_GWB1_40_9]